MIHYVTVLRLRLPRHSHNSGEDGQQDESIVPAVSGGAYRDVHVAVSKTNAPTDTSLMYTNQETPTTIQAGEIRKPTKGGKAYQEVGMLFHKVCWRHGQSYRAMLRARI